jgi:hypothetical protein
MQINRMNARNRVALGDRAFMTADLLRRGRQSLLVVDCYDVTPVTGTRRACQASFVRDPWHHYGRIIAVGEPRFLSRSVSFSSAVPQGCRRGTGARSRRHQHITRPFNFSVWPNGTRMSHGAPRAVITVISGRREWRYALLIASQRRIGARGVELANLRGAGEPPEAKP